MPDQTTFFRITIASPLHIGCDEVYEPTSFVVDEQARELVSFDTAAFLGLLDSDALRQFSGICSKGTILSLLELLKFMRTHAELTEQADCRRIRVPSEFIEHYKSTLGLPQNERTVQQELNNFQIKRTAFDPLTGQAYIPGSAIKGSIRTAVLNLRNQGRKEPRFRGQYAGRELQEHLLSFEFRHLESDPFRLLKVSDFFPANEAARAICYAVDRKKRPSEREAQAPYQILETVEPGVEFAGSITLLAPPGSSAGIRHPLAMDEIAKALRTFYGFEKQREDREVSGIGGNPVELPTNETSFPLRIGRHSGAECVTVNGHRYIKIMQGNGNPDKFLDHATTVWLAAGVKKPTTNQGLKPFGWVGFERLADHEGRQLLQEAARRKNSVIEAMRDRITARKKREEERLAKTGAEKREAEQRAALIAAEAAEKEAAAEKERQALAAMSDAERIAFSIQKQGTTENEIVVVFNQLDSFEPSDRKIIAAALKRCWELAGKWSKKQCSKKQWEKVQKVKSLLGEA